MKNPLIWLLFLNMDPTPLPALFQHPFFSMKKVHGICYQWVLVMKWKVYLHSLQKIKNNLVRRYIFTLYSLVKIWFISFVGCIVDNFGHFWGKNELCTDISEYRSHVIETIEWKFIYVCLKKWKKKKMSVYSWTILTCRNVIYFFIWVPF